MSRLGQFSDQPLINVKFEVSDSGNTRTIERLVNRGETGVIIEEPHFGDGLNPGRKVRSIIDTWNGDTPKTRIEVLPL